MNSKLLRFTRPVLRHCLRQNLQVNYGHSPDLEGYRTLKEPSTAELIEKKSRFVAKAWRIEDTSEAISLLKEHGDPKASHNCFAYKVDFESKFSDDGEPSGTGGKPIFAAIEMMDFDRVCVLVTRYFGGIKLGAGPLARAYGEAARQCLNAAKVEIIRPTVDAEVRLTYNSVFKIHPVLLRLNGKILSKVPTPSGLCIVTFRIEEQYYDDFKDYLCQITSVKIVPKIKTRSGLD